MTEIRLAIAGMGNCASSLVQGIHFYRDADPSDLVPGLMHVELGGYHVRDLELVAAFDVDATKVGLDAGKALFAEINNTIKFCDLPHLGVEVQRGPTLDGFGEFYREVAEESAAEPVDVAAVLRERKVDVERRACSLARSQPDPALHAAHELPRDVEAQAAPADAAAEVRVDAVELAEDPLLLGDGGS